jgi:hypothetical protein
MSKCQNLVGQKFGRLTVIEQATNNSNKSRWICRCDCGKETGPKYGFQLKSGATTNCGCEKIERCRAMAKNANRVSVEAVFKDISGERFGRLIVLERAQNRGKNLYYRCQCDCGSVKEVAHSAMTSGLTKSCGCLLSERSKERFTKHGCSAGCSDNTICEEAKRTYRIWKGMKQRCTNPNFKQWDDYGGRGISYDQRWDDFQNFLEDMGIAPHDRSIDRIDVDGNYCKGNCRWATASEQQRNKRKSRRD